MTEKTLSAEKPSKRSQGAVRAAPEAITAVSPELSAEDIAAVSAYLSVIAPAMRLSDWDISVTFDPELQDACAMVDAPTFQRRATVTIGAPFLADSLADRRDTLVHEMLHLVLMGAWQYTDQLLEQELPSRAAKIAWLGFCGQVECAIDHLAAIIAPTLPLPAPLGSDPGLTGF